MFEVKKSLDYYAQQFRSMSSDKMKEGNALNKVLDQLNALDCKLFNSPDSSKKLTLILNQCFSLVSPHDTFLVAKCCQLLLTLVGKQAVRLEKPLLSIAIPWCLQAIEQSADIALLDILQAVEGVIHTCTSDIEEMVGDILTTMSKELENKANLTTPQDVRVWRVQCIVALAPVITCAQRQQYVDVLFQLMQRKPQVDLDADVQVLKCVIEALEIVCQSDAEWLTENIGNVLGVVIASLHFGLPGWKPTIPSRLFPNPGAQWDPPAISNVKGKTKRRQKKRVSNISAAGVGGAGMEGEEDVEDKPNPGVKPRYMAAPSSAGLLWLTSDSEVSDSEGGVTRRLWRTQARLRLAAINLLVCVAKTVNVRDIFGYYSMLLGLQGLQHNLLNETNLRLSSAAASTMAFLLGNAKSYLAQAQYSRVTSYTPFSSVLASLLETLHQTMVRALSSSPACMSMLQCASCLVDVTPYHRMQPGLLPPLLNIALPYIQHKEVVVSVAAVTFLGCFVAVDPHTEELSTILAASLPPAPSPLLHEPYSRSWVLSLCMEYLEGDCQKTVQVPVQVEWWQVLSNMIRNHFLLIRPHTDDVVTAVLRDINSSSEHIRLHATRAFQHLTTVLGSSEVDEMECVAVWTRVLESQLLGLVGVSPILAAVVCDCLSTMSPPTYHLLPEKLQICCITCLLCCARDEEPSVRAAAVQALAAFLTFPTLTEDEQFVCDCSSVICQLVKDPIPQVSSKAVWALGNLTDMLYKNQHNDEIIPPLQLIKTSMEAALGKVKIRANGVRALGNLLGLLKISHLNSQEYKDVPMTVANILVKNASSMNSMKVSWNACYALGSMLKNEAIHEASSTWQAIVLPALCTLVVQSANFKVRTNACVALSSVSSRRHYGSHFLSVWKAVLEGMDHDLNMTDFKEVKHHDGLLEQLCLTLSHLASVVELADLSPLHEVVVYHIDTMQHRLSQFLASTLPERTEAVLKAATNVAQFRKEEHLTISQRDTVTILSDVFALSV